MSYDSTAQTSLVDKDFVVTPYIREVTKRALNYIEAGFPVHFRGPAGTGKSTLARYVASKLLKPISLILGDEEMTTADMIGGESGYSIKKVRDNFITTVLKEEEVYTKNWKENQLTEACKMGYTLIYDEFTRSRPEANNVFLSVLQDKILASSNTSGKSYIQVHPDFTAIFTSNPEEYAGTYKSQDALRDRMVTIDIDYPDFDTELAIVYTKARLPRDICGLITKIVRSLRESEICEVSPTVRGGIMIARTIAVLGIEPEDDVNLFTTYCQDILSSETSRGAKKSDQSRVKELIKEIVVEHIGEMRPYMAV